MLDYLKRDMILQKMGYASYKHYLASPLWKDIRARVLEKANGKCHICRIEIATQVHHRSYHKNVLNGQWISHLNAVCHPCHEQGEFRDNGQKVELREANARLSQALKPKKGFCVQCKKNPTRKGRSLCRRCNREELLSERA